MSGLELLRESLCVYFVLLIQRHILFFICYLCLEVIVLSFWLWSQRREAGAVLVLSVVQKTKER